MPAGGSRPGAGRKTKAEELKSSGIALEAITEKYGSLKEGMMFLLDSKEPNLIKFVFEHAAGKAPDKVDITTDGDKIQTGPQLSDSQFNKLTSLINASSNPG